MICHHGCRGDWGQREDQQQLVVWQGGDATGAPLDHGWQEGSG
jgi:hypothetical protein